MLTNYNMIKIRSKFKIHHWHCPVRIFDTSSLFNKGKTLIINLVVDYIQRLTSTTYDIVLTSRTVPAGVRTTCQCSVALLQKRLRIYKLRS